MPSPKGNILLFNKYMNSDKTPYVIYTDFESLIQKIDRCVNNPEKSSTTKIGEHIFLEVHSISTIWAFDIIENKHRLYRGKDCMKKFCTSLREHATNIINFENVTFVEKDSQNGFLKIKIVRNLETIEITRDHFTGKYRGAAHSICSCSFS